MGLTKTKVSSVQKNKLSFAFIMALPALIILIALVVGPLGYMFYNSFFSKSLAAPIPPRFIGFRNYIELFQNTRFWGAFINTAIIMAIGIPLQSLLGLVTALLLNKKFWGSKIIIALFMIPVLITPVVAGFQWKIILHEQFGPLNYILGLLGLNNSIAWLSNSGSAMASILMMDTWQWTPFATIVILAGLSVIPKHVYEAANVDGASAWETFWRVTMPLLKPIFTLVILLRSIFIFKIFDPVYILTGGGPGISTETLSVYTYYLGFKYFNIGLTTTLAVTQLIIITIIAKIFMGLIMKKKEEVVA